MILLVRTAIFRTSTRSQPSGAVCELHIYTDTDPNNCVYCNILPPSSQYTHLVYISNNTDKLPCFFCAKCIKSFHYTNAYNIKIRIVCHHQHTILNTTLHNTHNRFFYPAQQARHSPHNQAHSVRFLHTRLLLQEM